MTTNPAVSRVLQVAAVIASFILTALAVELGKGTVPIPEQWQWTVPILNAAITGALIFLPRYGEERLARQVDDLNAEGVPKSRMVVLSEHQAAWALATGPDEVADRINEMTPDDRRRVLARLERSRMEP